MNSIVKNRDWLDTAKGQYVSSVEQAWCDRVLEDVFGYHALQLGLSSFSAMRNNRIPHQWVAELNPWQPPVQSQELERSTVAQHPSVQLCLSASHLPFADENLDLVVLPHSLEWVEDPHGCLREVSRVLRPQGQVLILGFQAWSLFGLTWNLWRHYSKNGKETSFPPSNTVKDWPYRVNWISRQRIKDWLQLLDFEILDDASAVNRLPIDRGLKVPDISHHNQTLGSGHSFAHWIGAIYMIRAVKRVAGVRWMSPAWKNTGSRSVQAVSNVRVQKDLTKDAS